MASIYFEISGEVNVGVTITEQADGTLRFDIDVLDTTGSIGDLNAIYFDILDASLLDGLSVISGDDVTGEKYQADKVTKIDSFTNVNGEVTNELGKFDLGIQFGSSGIGEDDIRSTSFVLDHDGVDLTLAQFIDQDTAVRLTSVGEEGGTRDGSLKLGGVVDPITESGPTHVANDDTMTVASTETFSAFGFSDVLDTGGTLGVQSLLENDTTEGAAYTGDVLGVNGAERMDGFEFVGSDGGLLKVNANGTVDFSANGEFDDLAVGDSRVTHFNYEIEGGATGTLIVTVEGFDSNTGGGGGGGLDGIDPDMLPPDDPFGF